MDKVLNVTYASSLTDLCEVNSSFDKGILKIAYPGENRNKTSISKEAFERCIKTMYNCPIVCNYDRDTDTLGGHDMEIVRDSEGGLHIVNVTTPIGCIPESAKTWFAEVEEDDGTIHEYLFAEALLWKRQEAYRKIKDDGIVAQSMELTIKDGEMINDIYHIKDFEFTAFALIGVTPCFESASLEMFSKQDFKQQFSEMMQDLKDSFNSIDSSLEDEDIHPQKEYSTEGGDKVLDKKMELAAKYEIDIETLDFSIEDLSIDELTAKFEEIKAKSEDSEDNEDAEINESGSVDKFALTGNIIEELGRSLEKVTIEREWGECPRYWYVDCDFELSEVYCWDTADWLLYGFTYTLDGDNVVIDYECKKRKKYTIVDFDEGEQASPFATVFEQLENKLQDNSEWEAKYNTASETIKLMKTELTELRQFKNDTEVGIAETEREKIFAQFEDLVGIESFEQLRENCKDFDVETIEEKCYAIRGRNGVSTKFSLNNTPRIKVDKTGLSKEPYGDIFTKYGIGSND